ncbi:transporter substrate-binding domain-containing protein [Xylophilus sp. GOD-11R]|uniref:transporter substrate-binding domain-containing protein n=1 Tax=Xylophilus sp. GOD-11R TaxID=3089814 RepID=UPI00298BF557|nr:transporter substrate-binding domain-containing protein [Xylophilus sp. GOD-11R]WPB57194.1 transporter substrate-binding domain-containing protein [Xylophilus sp. GOD-11R]
MSKLPVSCPSIAALFIVASTALSAQAQSAASPTLDKVKSQGFITVAYRDSSIPFSYLADGQNPTGFAWEICGRIVDEVKKATGRADLQVKTQSVSSANRVPLLQNGTIDIECGSTTNNSERGKQVQFATNYFYTGTRFLVKAGSPIKTLADLKGRKVVSTTGTTNILVMRNVSRDKGLDLDILSAKDHAEAALLVESDRADAFAMDDILLYGIKANANRPDSLAVVGEALQVEPYAIMLRRDDPGFKQLVDGTIATLVRSGDFEKLYRKWFQSPIPPKGVNLNAPMSDELKANLTALSDKPAL